MPRSAAQEELLLALLMAAAISGLLLSLSPRSPEYVYAAFFLICATPLLKIRWLVGTSVLAAPVAVAAVTVLRGGGGGAGAAADGACSAPGWGAGALPLEAVVHLLVAWAVGGLMSYLIDTSRRQAFAHHTLALAAAEKELAEMRARAGVERELAAAQAQVRRAAGPAGRLLLCQPCVASLGRWLPRHCQELGAGLGCPAHPPSRRLRTGCGARSGGGAREGEQRGQERVHEPHVPRGPHAAQRLPGLGRDAAGHRPHGGLGG